MGGFFTKQWDTLGYYSDMVKGYISRAGGSPHMIRFPLELQSLPINCPKCGSSSGLMVEEMRQRLNAERLKFRDQTEKIISVRVANGESQPYPIHNNSDAEHQTRPRSVSYLFPFFRLLRRNSIVPQSPDKPNSEATEDPFYYPIDVNDLIVCQCMVEKHFVFEMPEQDELAAVISKNSSQELIKDERLGKCSNVDTASPKQLW